jgi:DNA-binding transcriptional LysR family regulator
MQPSVTDLQLRLKLRQLRVFLAVAEHGTLLKAAEYLHMSQPAVTKYVSDLELIVGARLFSRSSRGVTPTAFGEILIEHATLIMTELRQVSEKLSALSTGHAGSVVVGTLLAAAPRLLPRATALFKEQRPRLTVTITEGTNDRLLPALRQNALDLVVGRLPEARDLQDLDHEVLYDDPVHLVVRSSHKLARVRKLGLADLLDQQWILPPPQTTLRHQVEEAFRLEHLQPPGQLIETVSILTIRALLLETDVVAVLPHQVIKSDEELGLVKVLGIGIPTALRPVGITRRAGKQLTPAAELFCQCLRIASRDLVSSNKS